MFVWRYWATTVVKHKEVAEGASHGSAQSRPPLGGAREDPGCMPSIRLRAVLTPSKRGADTLGSRGEAGRRLAPRGAPAPATHTALNAALRVLPQPAPASPTSAESSGANGRDGGAHQNGDARRIHFIWVPY